MNLSTVPKDEQLKVLSYPPPGFVPGEERDVVIFMHGMGGNPRHHTHMMLNLPKDKFYFFPYGPIRFWPNRTGASGWFLQIQDDLVHTHLIKHSIKVMHEFIQSLPERFEVRPRKIILAGFSQGGTMSVTYPLVYPGEIDVSFCIAGYIAKDESLPVTAETVAGTKFVWCHGRRDFVNDYYLAEWGVEKLTAVNADLTFRPRQFMSHEVYPPVLQDLSAVLQDKPLPFLPFPESGQ